MSQLEQKIESAIRDAGTTGTAMVGKFTLQTLLSAWKESKRDTQRWTHACVLMALAVIGLMIACVFVARHSSPVIVVPHECPQSAYNDGPNYRYLAVRYRWRHV